MASGSVCRPDLPPTYRNTYREQPLPMQRAPAPSPEALTLEQRQFAAEQHNLIYTYLNEKGLYHEEYYDIAAFGYLQAVKRYLSQPALRQYAFSTIAWRAMRQSIAAFHRSEERRKAAERAFAESQPVATDAWDALEGSLIAIHYDAPDAMRFETLNTHYTLLLGPAPQTAANPTMLMPVAA